MLNASLTLSNRLRIKDLIDGYETSCLLEIYKLDIVSTFIYDIYQALQLSNLMLLHNNIK